MSALWTKNCVNISAITNSVASRGSNERSAEWSEVIVRSFLVNINRKALRSQVAIGTGWSTPVVSVGPLSSHLQEGGTGSGRERVQVTEQQPLKTFDAAVENEPALQRGTSTKSVGLSGSQKDKKL